MRRGYGFTLLELLLALAIFAVVSALAYGGLRSVLDTQAQTDRSAERLSELQKAILFLERDLAQTAPRGIRDALGDPMDPLVGSAAGVEFTRTGWNNPVGQARSTLQRIAYRVDDETLVRSSWSMLDRSQDSEPYRAVLLEGVDEMSLRFMDGNREWAEDWPPPDRTQGPALPLAVELTLQLDEWGELRRIFLLPGQ